VPVPTRRLATVALGLAAVVLVLPVSMPVGLLVVDGALLVAAFFDWVRAPAPSTVRAERRLPAVLTLGATGTVAWRVVNPVDRQLHVGLADELAPSLGAGVRRAWLDIPPNGAATATTEIRPSRRGRFEIRAMVLRVEGPLGLVARQGRRTLPAVLRVHPEFRSKKEAELRITRARVLEVGLRSAQGRGGGTEFEQLREYTPDDEFRRVDWAATARTGRAIVRTYRAERNQTVLALLDNGRVMAGQVGGVPRVEHAMDAVMALTAVATRLGDKCGLLAFDRRVRAVVPPSKTVGQLARVTEAMYDLHPELAESDYAGAFTETVVRFRKRALLVVLTELVEQAVGEWLLPALPLIGREHVVVIGAVRDPDVQSWATTVPNDSEDSYRKSAAVAALDERARTVARLRAAGATVVDAEPGKLAPQLVDAYLKVKATGRL
jgi:uncharacterized protein (DUF58 family)